jgi:hypothetical protein
MKNAISIILLMLCFNSCSLFKSDEDKAIELVQQTQTGMYFESKTWLDKANEDAKEDPNNKFVWEAKKTEEESVFLVSFQDTAGWGTRWEVILKQKIVKTINGNDYLSRKYNITRLDANGLFTISNTSIDTLMVDNEKISQGFWADLFSSPKYRKVVIYKFQAEVTNNTDKYITNVDIEGKLKLIFKEKTIVGTSGFTSFNSSVSKDKPWIPGETITITLKTKNIDKVYLNYIPEYAIFELNLEAQDPIGFSYDKNIWEVNLTERWSNFTASLKNNKVKG